MRPGHRRIFQIKIQKDREKQQREEEREQAKQKREEEDQEEMRKREKVQQKSKQEMEDELAKIEMSKKLERARQKRGKLNTSMVAAQQEVENKEGSMAHDTTASTDLPSDKLHHAFISHKKKHTAFGGHYEMLSIRLKVKTMAY